MILVRVFEKIQRSCRRFLTTVIWHRLVLSK